MGNYTVITLTPDEMQKCVEFSQKSAETQQDIEFGQKDTKPRSKKEIARDNLIGKMAEVAVSKMLRDEFKIHVPVNFDIYPRGEWDDCDIQIKAWVVDIKSTRNGNWLLFEIDKLRMRGKQKICNLPDAVFMCRTPWDKGNDSPKGNYVEVVGAISLVKLLSKNSKILHLKKGDFIPHTQMPLQADNIAVHFDDLEHDWSKTISYMVKNPPPDSSKFRLP